MENSDLIDLNRTFWNAAADAHLESEFYDVKSFRAGKSSLRGPEIEYLGDVRGKQVLHLQCHFGLDTLSLARMGAEVIGVDFSENAIIAAVDLASECKINADFICCDIYKLMNCLIRNFDIVFTTYGTVGWLPDLDMWARTVSYYVKPGGQFIMADFHPLIWMYEEDMERPAHRYFNSGPIIDNQNGTYATDHKGPEMQTAGWNHALSEIISSLLRNGLSLRVFKEYDYSPYNCFKNMSEAEPGKFRFTRYGDKLPIMYCLVMEKTE
jgi:2-polyprenyl-3-methyl-5-hydroxy-6-metoxy-1,4-benzoquinol methylase